VRKGVKHTALQRGFDGARWAVEFQLPTTLSAPVPRFEEHSPIRKSMARSDAFFSIFRTHHVLERIG